MPLLSTKHVQDGRIEYRDFGLIDKNDFDNARLRCSPQENDILIVSVGATTGRAGIVKQEPPFAIVRSVLMLRPLINPVYFLTWTQQPWCQDWIRSASGSTAQAHFYIRDAKRFPVAVPPEREQLAMADERERIVSSLDVLQEALRTKSRSATALRKAILEAAFSGKLVTQDINDEPASFLLERIRSEHATAPSKVARRSKKEPIRG